MTRFTFSRLFLTIVIIQTIAGVTLLFAEDCFVARWVNGTDANPSYYMADFWVPLKRHNNIGTYTPDFCSGCIIEADEFPAAVDHAVNTWNGAGLAGVPAYFNIQLESNVSSGQILNQFDGNNVIGFSTNAAEANMLSSENLTLAFCRVYIPEVFYTCPENNPLGPRFISDGADILFNRNRPFDVISATEANNLDYQRYDFESVVVHELSHFAGLCHTANYHDATNAVIYNADNSRRTLGDAATSIYNLYNLASLPQVAPCSVFKNPATIGGDTGGQNPGTGGGGGGNNCRFVTNPDYFSADARKNIALFNDQNIRWNINVFCRRIVQNQQYFDEILTSNNPRYQAVQAAFKAAFLANQNIVERTFVNKESINIKPENLMPVCLFLKELYPLVNAPFQEEIKKLSKGLSTMEGKNIKTALLNYDQRTDFSNIALYCGQ